MLLNKVRRRAAVLLILFTQLLFFSKVTKSSKINYNDIKEKLIKCECFKNILSEMQVDKTPKGITSNALHLMLDEVIASHVNEINKMKKARTNNRNIKVGFSWSAGEFADDPPPNDVSITDMNLDDTREFIRKYDLPITISMKDGRSKEDIVKEIERAVRIARKERVNAHVGSLRQEDNVIEIKYIIIGAGPAGLQQAYFLQRENRDYIVFEKAAAPGSFFEKYPRSRTLSSLNRKYIYGASENDEISFRYDDNSLLSDNYELKFSKYTQAKYPHADIYNHYLHDYAQRTNLKIKYLSKVVSIKRQHRVWNGGFISSKKKKSIPNNIEQWRKISLPCFNCCNRITTTKIYGTEE